MHEYSHLKALYPKRESKGLIAKQLFLIYTSPILENNTRYIIRVNIESRQGKEILVSTSNE